VERQKRASGEFINNIQEGNRGRLGYRIATVTAKQDELFAVRANQPIFKYLQEST
jgi:hypothetical protein